MERRHREGKKPAHCAIADKWQNCGLQQSPYPEPPHSHHAVPFTKNAFHSLNCWKASGRLQGHQCLTLWSGQKGPQGKAGKPPLGTVKYS